MTGYKSKRDAALDEDGMYLVHHIKRKDDDDTQVYQRTWVSLTEADLKPICDEWRIVYGSWADDFARDIEAKLKELNS
jgi:hypothetical protein